MVGKLEAAVAARVDPEFVIIARCNALAHEGLDDALARCAAYEAAGADMLLLFPTGRAEFDALSTETKLPLVAMLPIGRPVADLLGYGFSLGVDPFSATVRSFAAVKAGYEAFARGELDGSWDEALLQLKEIGETIGIERLYEIEARTTERALYETGI